MLKWIFNALITTYLLLTSNASAGLAGELPITLPYTITQDEAGFIWVGTQSNAVRHDGHQQIPLAENIGYIRKILPTQNTVYVVGSHGIIVIDPQLNETQIYKTQNSIFDAVMHKHDLYVIEQEQILKFTLTEQVASKRVIGFEAIESGKIAAINNMLCFTGGVKLLRCIDDTPENNLLAVLHLPTYMKTLLKHQEQLIVSSKNAIYTLNPNTLVLNKIHEVDEGSLSQVAPAINNHLWLIKNDQPFLFNLKSKTYEQHNFSRTSNSKIKGVFQSSDSTLWLAANKLEHLQNNIGSITKVDGLNSTSGMAWLVQDKHYYAFDIAGVSQIETTEKQGYTKKPVTHINDKVKGHIYTAHKTEDYYWFGGYYGLFRASHNFDEFDDLTDSIAKRPVQCLNDENSLSIYVCVANTGVYKIDKSTFKTELIITNSNINSIVDINIESITGNAWLATDSGLYKYKDKTFTQYLPDSHAIRIEEGNGALYVATLDDGLFKLTERKHAIQIEQVKLPGLGRRINDISFDYYAKVLNITTGIGIASYNTETGKVDTWPLGKSIGRILRRSVYFDEDSNNVALSADGELISWPSVSKNHEFKKHVMLTSFLVNGVEQPISTTIDDGSYIELGISSNVFSNVDQHRFSIKLNDNPWSKFSSVNHIGFLPKPGLNIVKFKVSADSELTHAIRFYVSMPWYGSIWAKLGYCMLILGAIALAIRLYVNNSRKFILLTNDYEQKINALHNESKQAELTKQAQLKQQEKNHYNRLRSVFNHLTTEHNEFVSRLKLKEDSKIELDYDFIFNKLTKAQALLAVEQTASANKLISEVMQQAEFNISLLAPSVLLNGDIATTIQTLAITQQARKQFCSVAYEQEGIIKPANDKITKEAYRIMYKCVYELLVYLVGETSALDITLTLSSRQGTLYLTVLTKDYKLTSRSFSKDNIGLYQTKLLVQHMKGQFKVERYARHGSLVSLSVPIVQVLSESTAKPIKTL